MSDATAPLVQLLSRTPSILWNWLADLDESWLHANEGPETWSPYQVLGHLTYGEEADWIPRAQRILSKGERVPFESFDRFAQDRLYSKWPVAKLLTRFDELRTQNLSQLVSWNLDDEQLALTGRHPELGEVTLGELIHCWTVHDLGHLAQIARVMAKCVGEKVGPWSAYLPVLHR